MRRPSRRRSRQPGLPRPLVALALATAIGVVGAGIVHVASVLAVPSFAPRTGFDIAGELGADGRFVPLEQDDPYLRAVVCRFGTDMPARVLALGDVPHWSASVVTPEGVIVYSLNDRVALDGALDLVVLRTSDVARWRPILSNDVELVPVPGDRAMVVLRSFVADPTWEAAARRFLDAAVCEPLEDGPEG